MQRSKKTVFHSNHYHSVYVIRLGMDLFGRKQACRYDEVRVSISVCINFFKIFWNLHNRDFYSKIKNDCFSNPIPLCKSRLSDWNFQGKIKFIINCFSELEKTRRTKKTAAKKLRKKLYSAKLEKYKWNRPHKSFFFARCLPMAFTFSSNIAFTFWKNS